MEGTTERLVWASQEPGEAGYLKFDWEALGRLMGTSCISSDEAYRISRLLDDLGYDYTLEVVEVYLDDQIPAATIAAEWAKAWDELAREVRK